MRYIIPADLVSSAGAKGRVPHAGHITFKVRRSLFSVSIGLALGRAADGRALRTNQFEH